MAGSHKEVGRRLELTRRALGFKTQVEFCKAIKIDKTVWNPFETGVRRITLTVALKIRHRFAVPLDWIYCGDPSGLPDRIAKELDRLAA